MNERSSSSSILPLLMALGMSTFDEVLPRRAGRRQRAAAPAPRPRAPRPGPETVRLPCPHEVAARALDGRVWQHQQTGEIRGSCWTPAGIEFHNPQTGDVFVRPFRKALLWCEQATDVTPSESELGDAPLPPEIPAHPIAGELAGGAP